MTKVPRVSWSQRSNTVFCVLDIQDAKDVKVEITDKSITVSATAAGGEYAHTWNHFAEVDPEESKWVCRPRQVEIALSKVETEWWDRLTKETGKKPWLTVDWKNWADEDEEDEAPDMGDFGGMGGMPDMGGMGGMGGAGGMGGMDLQAMMAQMGGMGGGGIPGGLDVPGPDGPNGLEHMPPPSNIPPMSAEELAEANSGGSGGLGGNDSMEKMMKMMNDLKAQEAAEGEEDAGEEAEAKAE